MQKIKGELFFLKEFPTALKCPPVDRRDQLEYNWINEEHVSSISTRVGPWTVGRGDRVHQRVFNDLKRARPSRERMIWLLASPQPPPPPVGKLDQRHT